MRGLQVVSPGSPATFLRGAEALLALLLCWSGCGGNPPTAIEGVWKGTVDSQYSETWTFSAGKLDVVDQTLSQTCSGTYSADGVFTLTCPKNTDKGTCQVSGATITCSYQWTTSGGATGNSTFNGTKQ